MLHLTTPPPCVEGLHNNLDYNLIDKPNLIKGANKIDDNESKPKRQRSLSIKEKIFVSQLTNAYFNHYKQQKGAARSSLPSYSKLEAILTNITAGNDRNEAAWERLNLGLPAPQQVLKEAI